MIEITIRRKVVNILFGVIALIISIGMDKLATNLEILITLVI
jgi:hypothetical protein